MSHLFPMVFAFLALGPASNPQSVAERDRRQLEGIWYPTDTEMRGDHIAGEFLRPFQWVWLGNRFLGVLPPPPGPINRPWKLHANQSPGADSLNGTWKLDASQNPKTIDLIISAGRCRGMTVKGIYRVTADRLELCLGQPSEEGPERPKEFSGQSDSPNLYIVLRKFDTTGP